MNKKIVSGANFRIVGAVFLFFLFVVAYSPVGLAQSQCLTDVSTTTSTSRATTGTSVTITVSTTGSSCTISTLAFVSSPSLTINDPSSGQYGGFSAGTTKSFSITAGTSGTYNYYAQGTTTSGSVDSTSQILEFVSPSDLTVTASPSSASVTSGNSFSLSISVQNPQSSGVTTSYALNLPSGLTRSSGDPASSSGTTIDASSTKTLSYTVQHSTCFTGSKTITFDLGSTSGAASVSVTGNSSCTSGTTTTTTPGGGGSTGSNATSTVTKENRTLSVITPGAAAVTKFASKDLGIKEIQIEVNSPAHNITITILKLAGQPASVTKTVTGTVYQYIDINITNLSSDNVNRGKIKFNITKSWLTQNSFSISEVSLRRFSGGNWEKLVTSLLTEGPAEAEYESVTPGFSTFAIVGEKTVTQPTTQPVTNGTAAACGNNVREGSEECDGSDIAGQTCSTKNFQGGTLKCTDCKFDTSACTGQLPPSYSAPQTEAPAIPISAEVVYIIVVLVVIVGIGYWHYHRNPEKKILSVMKK